MRIATSLTIQVPIREVFAYIANPCCWTEWMTGVSAVYRHSARPLEIGETFDRIDHPNGHGLRSSWEVTEHEPPGLLSCRRIGGGGPVVIRQTLERVGEGTRLTVSGEGEVSTPSAGGTEVQQAIEWQLEHELGGLKELLERRDVEHSRRAI